MTQYLRFGQMVAAGLLLAGLTQAAPASAANITVSSLDMGSADRVTHLVSYPNCLSNCPSPQYPQTLSQTVAHYLQQSLQRDGLTSSKVTVSQQGDKVVAQFTGPAAVSYPKALTAFLDDGDLAYQATLAIQQSGRWKDDWRFFLPWGLALTKNPTIELLHFPPDYSLTGQDYLNAKTTERWAGLLTVNGVPAAQTDAYQAIVDIAPIAAPASAGSDITNANVYGDYYPYSGALLGSWARWPNGQGKPMVAFGAPVRDWVTTYLHLTLAVDQAGTATLPNGTKVPVIASNHPSMIYYAAFNQDHSENFDAGMKVMRQDLIASCWQASMGQTPSQDPLAVQTSCTTSWTSNTYGVCMQLETTIYNKTTEQAAAICGAGGALVRLNEPSDEEVAKLERP